MEEILDLRPVFANGFCHGFLCLGGIHCVDFPRVFLNPLNGFVPLGQIRFLRCGQMRDAGDGNNRASSQFAQSVLKLFLGELVSQGRDVLLSGNGLLGLDSELEKLLEFGVVQQFFADFFGRNLCTDQFTDGICRLFGTERGVLQFNFCIILLFNKPTHDFTDHFEIAVALRFCGVGQANIAANPLIQGRNLGLEADRCVGDCFRQFVAGQCAAQSFKPAQGIGVDPRDLLRVLCEDSPAEAIDLGFQLAKGRLVFNRAPQFFMPQKGKEAASRGSVRSLDPLQLAPDGEGIGQFLFDSIEVRQDHREFPEVFQLSGLTGVERLGQSRGNIFVDPHFGCGLVGFGGFHRVRTRS